MIDGSRALFLLGLLLLVSWSLPSVHGVSTWLAADQRVTEADSDADDRDCSSACPGDDENGECPPECDACPCCPSAVTPAVVSGELPTTPTNAHAEVGPVVPSGRAQEGALSRVFHPPRAATS